MQESEVNSLIDAARNAALNSYSPYSKFRVGAAILANDGSVHTGANVENRSYGLTICAERSAIAGAISAGSKTFVALAVACIDAETPVPPCGACRQVVSEFTGIDFSVFYAGKGPEVQKASMGELLPYDSLHDLKTGR